MLPIPQLNTSAYARRGFDVIATANDRDKGMNKLSAALNRRFNVVILPLPDNMDEEVVIVTKRVAEMAVWLELTAPRKSPVCWPSSANCGRGRRWMVKQRLSRRRARSLRPRRLQRCWAGFHMPPFFYERNFSADELAPTVMGAIIKKPVQDKAVLEDTLKR